MRTHLLSIPSKKTDEVEWARPLNAYLTSIYGKNSEYGLDIQSFNQLRQDIRGANADSNGVKLYYKYYSCLELIDLRIPFSTINRSGKVSFTWYDTFSPSVSHKQSALPFEKANVLFNLASVLSRFATKKYSQSQNDSSASADETTKETLMYLQQAAGILEFVNENFLHAPLNDLSKETVKFLTQLLLAQSQEVFLLKVVSGDLDQSKNTLISKLARSASAQYEACFNDTKHLLQDSLLNSDYDIYDTQEEEFLEGPAGEEEEIKIASRIDPLWMAVMNFKAYYYKSLAYYFNGLAMESSKKFGNAIAYVTKSQEILNEISDSNLKALSKAESGYVYELLDNYKYQKDAIQIKLGELDKDNDFIYHEIVPSLTTLPDIKPMDGTKVIPLAKNASFNDINDHNYQNFLANVVPMNIHELLSYYSEEKAQFLRNEIDLVDVSNEELSSVLEVMKLPGSLHHIKEMLHKDSKSGDDDDSIDPNIYGYAKKISSKYQEDQSNRKDIMEKRKVIYQTITESETLLSQKISENSIELKHKLIELKRSLYDASGSDKKLFSLINDENYPLYTSLGKGPNSSEFKSLFDVESGNKNINAAEPDLLDIDISKPASKTPDGLIERMESCLHDLYIVKSNKAKLIETLKKEIHNDDISDILVLNSKTKSTNEIKSVIFPEELKKFEPYNKELDKLIDNQKTIIKRLQETWDTLHEVPAFKEIQKSSEFKLKLIKDQSERIAKLYQAWSQYSEGLGRGVEFYNKLLGYSRDIKTKIVNVDQAPVRASALNSSFDSLSIGRRSPPPMYSPPMYTQHKPSLTDAHSQPPPLISRTSTSSSGLSYSRPPPQLPGKFPDTASVPPLPPKAPRIEEPSLKPLPGVQPPSKPEPTNDLIYNQPSKYQPNMYDFFSNK